LIEVNGKQHYEKMNYHNADEAFERTKRHDKLKTDYATLKGMKLLTIDMRHMKNIEDIKHTIKQNIKQTEDK